MANMEKVRQDLEELKSCSEDELVVQFTGLMPEYLQLSPGELATLSDTFHEWALGEAERSPRKLRYAELLLSARYTQSGKNPESLLQLVRTEHGFEELGDEDGLAIANMMTGIVYRSMGNVDLALKSLWKAYVHFRDTGHCPFFLAGCCNAMGHLNLELHDLPEARSLYKQGTEVIMRIGDDYFTIYTLHGLGKVSLLEGEPEAAAGFMNLALEVAQSAQSQVLIANSLTELANLRMHTNELAEAERLHADALAIREGNYLIGPAVTNCLELGEIHLQQGRQEDALRILTKAHDLAESINLKPKLAQAHLLLSRVCKSIRSHEESLVHHEAYHALRETIHEEDGARRLSDAKLIFEAELTKKENAVIRAQKEVIEKKNRELQETIDELTITKVSRKAKALTLGVAVVLFFFEDPIVGFGLRTFHSDNYFLSVFIKMVIIFSLSPINGAIERLLLNRVVLKKRHAV